MDARIGALRIKDERKLIMHEEFNFRIEKQNNIITIYSNNGEKWNEIIYLSYENALWLINKLRPMTFEELTNNKKFDVKEFEHIINDNEVLSIKSCFVDRGNCWFDISSYWDNKEYEYGTMTLPFSIIEQFEDKFYFKEFVYPFLDELEKYLPDEYKAKVIHQNL